MSDGSDSGPLPGLARVSRFLFFFLLLATLLTTCTRHDPASSWKRAFCLDTLRTTGAFLDVISGHATFGHPTELPQLVRRLNEDMERLGTAAGELHRDVVSTVNLAFGELSLARSWTDPRDPHLISVKVELAQLGQSFRLSPQEICPRSA